MNKKFFIFIISIIVVIIGFLILKNIELDINKEKGINSIVINNNSNDDIITYVHIYEEVTRNP